MSGGEGDLSPAHWRQATRGGRQASGRSGSSNANYHRSQQHYRDHQYDDLRQQSNYQGERGFSHRGQQHGRSYGSFAQQQDGISVQHEDQRHQSYSRHNPIDHPHAGFRGQPMGPRFNPAEGRQPDYMHYPPESMLAGPQRAPEHWQNGPVPSYQHPSVASQGIHAQYRRPTALVDQPQYPLPQPFPQHQVAGGHLGTGIGMCAAGAVGGSVAMPGPVYHPSGLRLPHHGGAWTSGAPAPEHRTSEAFRAGGTGPGRGAGGRGSGGQSRGGIRDGGVANSGGAGSTAARRTSRAPPVPQPLVQNSSPQGEPVNSGILSLGRPRQQPSNTVNNVQSMRGVTSDAAQTLSSTNNSKSERVPVNTANKEPAESGGEPAPAAETAALVAGVEAELGIQGKVYDAPAMPLEVDEELHAPFPTGPLGPASAEAVPPAGLGTATGSSSGCTESGIYLSNPSVNAGSPPACAAVNNVGTLRATGSIHPEEQECQALVEGSAVAQALQNTNPLPQASLPPEAMPGSVQAAGEKPVVLGSAWRQRPATALFASPAAGGHAAVRKANTPAAHSATAPQGGAAPGVTAAMTGAQPIAITSTVSRSSTGPHQNNPPAARAVAAMGPEQSCVPPPRVQNRPAPIQTGPPQQPRCPPPGFGGAPLASVSPVGAATVPGDQGPVAQQPENAHHLSQLPQQQLSPRVSAGSEALGPAMSPARTAQVAQHSPATEASEPYEGIANRKWASVAAKAASSGGAHPKAPIRRPVSEGGTSDASTAVAAATLVGLRHAAHQPLGTGSGVSPVSTIVPAAAAAAFPPLSIGDADSAQASSTTAGAASSISHPVACAAGATIKEPVAPVALGAGPASQQGHAALSSKAVVQPGPSNVASTSTPLQSKPPSGLPSGGQVASAAVKGAAASTTSTPGHRSWVDAAIASPANIKRAPMGPGAGPKQATTGLGNDTPCSEAAAVSSSVADAATSAASSEKSADANVVEALPGAATVALGQGVEDTNADTLEAEARKRTWEWVATNDGEHSTPAVTPVPPPEQQESVKPVAVTVDSTTELPEAAPRAVEPAAPAEVPAAQAKQSWAAMAAARPPQLIGHAVAQAAAPKRSAAFQGRGLAGRERHVQNSNRGLSAQPPEGMFFPPAAAPVPPAAGALTPKKASEDGHGVSRPSPSTSHVPSGPVSMKLTVDADSKSTAAAVTPTTHTVGTADISKAPAVDASASECGSSGTAGVQAASSVDAVQQGDVKSVVTDSHGGPAAASASVKANAAAAAAAVPGVPRQTDGLHARPSSVAGSELGVVKAEAAEQQDDGDDTGFQLVIPRHKAGKVSRGTEAGHAHPGPSTGTAGAGAGRGRGRYGDPTAAAAGPQQRGTGAHGHLAVQGGRGRGAAGHSLLQGPQHFAAGGKHGATAPADLSMGPVATIPVASSSAIAQPASSTDNAGSAALGVLADAQANANGASVPLAVIEPLAAPAVSEADATASKEAAAAVPTVGQDDTATPTVAVTLPVAIAASAAALESLAAQENVQGSTAIVASPNEATTPVPEDVPAVGNAEAGVAPPPPQGDAPKKTPVQRTQSQARGPGSKKKDKRDGTEAIPREAEREQDAKPLEEEEEEEDNGSAAIPTGSNPWGLLGAAGEEDGAGAAAAEVPAAFPAGTAAGNGVASFATSTASSSETSLVEALRQLLSPATAEQLLAVSQFQHQAGGFRLQPRGLTNTGNTCFINATMQALLACAPFAFVLSRLPTIAPLLEPSKSPTLHSLALFLGELVSPQSGAAGFVSAGSMASGREDAQQAAEDEGWAEVQSHRGKKGQRKGTSANAPQQPASPMVPATATSSSIATKGEAPGSVAVVLGGQPLVPSMLNGIVAAFNPRISIAERQTMSKVLSKGVVEQEQQDAQEFFLFLVNQVHEEVVALRKAHGLAAEPAATAGTGAGGDGEEWAQVGRKNKATVTRQVGAPADDAASRSPVTAIFSGLVKSTVRFQQPNYKPSATIEAFNMLHLDIAAEGVNTLEDALRQHSVPESIEYKPDGATEMLPAKKDAKLYRLPEVLVLHLKRFTYTAAGGGRYTKVQKPVTFNCTLRLEGKILAEDCPDRANAEYRLFATINHHGRTIAGGHYMTDVLQPDNRWLRFNDAEVYVVTESAVLGERPYLLFYQRVPQRGA
ncbi:hypothetical protein Vafri_2667 [Volvox africanus]|uniref:ubiquitinyl hydrolase 1 n=1 Tax=Volvox africanus TaxID=51714 RepID=A0A8J4EVJ3_9CHLO|nr:hypothetical protein Vafri_2667 [Volvox africanus]